MKCNSTDLQERAQQIWRELDGLDWSSHEQAIVGILRDALEEVAPAPPGGTAQSILHVVHKAVEAEAIRMGEDTYSVSLASAVAEAVDRWLATAPKQPSTADLEALAAKWESYVKELEIRSPWTATAYAQCAFELRADLRALAKQQGGAEA